MWPFRASAKPLTTAGNAGGGSEAARTLAKLGQQQRHAKVIAAMNQLRDELGMPHFEVRS